MVSGSRQVVPPDAEVFQTPKAERLIRRILDMSTVRGDLVLDSFAGSGTTERVLNELKLLLGLELTATPEVETGSKTPAPFNNIIYSYPLSSAIADGFVKEPAVATRENFKADAYTKEQLRLEDGVRVHEATKVELETYARNHDLPIVKPFVGRHGRHHRCERTSETMEHEKFFEGRYKVRVITVHSNQRGDEKDDVVERLLAVEDPKEPTEIVIQMLKEGWVVTNLYTIVPLRKANSRTLVEQSIGRGLRPPYAKRVGVQAVDRLTIVAHDHLEEIIKDANRPDSVIRSGVVIGRRTETGHGATVIGLCCSTVSEIFPARGDDELRELSWLRIRSRNWLVRRPFPEIFSDVPLALWRQSPPAPRGAVLRRRR